MSEAIDAISPAGQDTPVLDEVQQPAATPENVAPAPEGTEAQESEVKTQAEKTLTQTEVNEIIQREKAKAEAKAERRANKAYRDTLERLIQQRQEPQKQTESDGRPERARFNSDEEWVEAVADWKIGLRDRQMASHRQQEQQRSLVEKSERIYAEAEKIKGFDRQAFDDIPITPVISAAIMESDISGKLMAYMVENPDEVEKIVRLSPARQAAEIGKMEAKVLSAPTPQVSRAPAPITPVGGNKSNSKDPSEMSDAEFAKWRREQIKLRGS